MLNYKASNIAKVEREYGANFLEKLNSLGAGSVSDILFLLQSGGLTEEEASDLFDSKGITATFDLIAEALTKSGFLAATPEVQEAIAKEKLSKETSQSSGQTAKAQPTK